MLAVAAAAPVKVVSEGKEYFRQPVETFTRVMGYYRPVSFFNSGKKSEFYSRKYFCAESSMNGEFAKRFS